MAIFELILFSRSIPSSFSDYARNQSIELLHPYIR